MPRLAKRKYAPRRKLVRRKQYARRKPTGLVNRALHPIPQRYVTKMKYADVISTDFATGQFSLNLNSLFDPNRSGVGHQPYGFDTLATLYNRYRVIACGYRITCGVTSSLANPIQVAAMPGNEVQVFGTMSEIKENPRSKYILQNPGAPSTVLSGKQYIPSLVGRTKAQYMADDRYQSLVTGSPNELAILNIATAGAGDALLGSVTLQLIMEFTVEFFDIKTLAQS